VHLRKGDRVDPAVGVVARARVGDRAEPGAPLAEVHARDRGAADAAARQVLAAYRFAAEPPAPESPYEVMGG
jgi:thymidine phosphorylase